MIKKYYVFILLVIFYNNLLSQSNSLVNTSNSPFTKLYGIGIKDIQWTKGFWAERFEVCKNSMVPNMLNNYMDSSVSHAFTNFEIAAGLKVGNHVGPPFHDGDFYKMLEGLIMVYSVTNDINTGRHLDSIIRVISLTQRKDGYIHTPVVIAQLKNKDGKNEFSERLHFETYNMGHLMTAACIHYRVTGKKNLLDIAIKATDFLYNFYKRASAELARNAICPSHYMGVIEMYRTTGDPKYLELAKQLIEIRGLVENGTDDNQDRVPFKQQTKAIGHAVRANYLYAGATDVFIETGDDSLMLVLDKIWHNLTERKMYITGACGALYDGVSPDGTSYKPPFIQKVHQAYGRDYQLPNLTAHNESCANIGNMLWNWRMFMATADAGFIDVMEQTMYNSLLSAVSLDGKRYFYTNPLCVNQNITYNLRWSKEREEYISYCNCCPPNTIRTISEIHNYMYSLSNEGLWVNFYGGNNLTTTLKDGSEIKLSQVSNYPWDGNVKITINKAPKNEFALFIRIPQWCKEAELLINGKKSSIPFISGKYTELKQKWNYNDVIELQLAMPVQLIESNPLVEETRNQVAIKRGPVVYCLESMDIPENINVFDISIPIKNNLQPEFFTIENSNLICLKGDVNYVSEADWKNSLYREVPDNVPSKVQIRLIPYFAWGNRGKGDMVVWVPLSK